jgi:hypothetical protein
MGGVGPEATRRRPDPGRKLRPVLSQVRWDDLGHHPLGPVAGGLVDQDGGRGPAIQTVGWGLPKRPSQLSPDEGCRRHPAGHRLRRTGRTCRLLLQRITARSAFGSFRRGARTLRSCRLHRRLARLVMRMMFSRFRRGYSSFCPLPPTRLPRTPFRADGLRLRGERLASDSAPPFSSSRRIQSSSRITGSAFKRPPHPTRPSRSRAG